MPLTRKQWDQQKRQLLMARQSKQQLEKNKLQRKNQELQKLLAQWEQKQQQQNVPPIPLEIFSELVSFKF